MEYYFAPMEGITRYLYRNIHRELFPGIDRYYMPFQAPHLDGTIQTKERMDADPVNNRGTKAIPQILVRDPDCFIFTAKRIRNDGYEEVNLNLGCPYRTVVTKGKGSGFLEHPEELDRFLDRIFSEPDMPGISIKTRLAPEDETLRIFEKYPLTELIVHPRHQAEMYRGHADVAEFDRIAAYSRHRLCYNGDLFTPADVLAFEESHPELPAVMLGRGLLCNPALVRVVRGGESLSIAELQEFHDRLYAAYRDILSGPASLIGRMKELWMHWEKRMDIPKKVLKAVYKAKKTEEYEAAVRTLFAQSRMLPDDQRPVY